MPFINKYMPMLLHFLLSVFFSYPVPDKKCSEYKLSKWINRWLVWLGAKISNMTTQEIREYF